jgi:hypothetical protein
MNTMNIEKLFRVENKVQHCKKRGYREHKVKVKIPGMIDIAQSV